MATTTQPASFTWSCQHTWRSASKNTLWCLAGCSIGDWGTILFFQLTGISWSTLAIMLMAIVNGILTSIALETVILARQMTIATAFRTAIGMSLISMLSMEIAMNLGRRCNHRRRDAYLVDIADHVCSRFYGRGPVQLLETQGVR